jgi:hypothetical protein
MVGFARKIEDCREAGFRLANRRLQPLGHLTAARKLSINDITTYTNAIVPTIAPEIVPVGPGTEAQSLARALIGAITRRQRFFSG